MKFEPHTVLPDLSKPNFQSWLIVALLWGAICLNYLDRLMITTMRGSIMEAIPMTEAQFGLLTSIFLIVYAIVSPFAGYFSDRFNRSHIITGCVLTWSLVTLLTPYARTYEQLVFSRALLALSQAACMPASATLIVDYHRGSTRSLASGIILSGAMAGAAMSGLGGWFADAHDWTYSYKLFGFIGIVYAVGLMFLLRELPFKQSESTTSTPPERIKLKEAFISLATNRAYLSILVFGSLLGVVGWSVIGWMPTYIKEHFNLTEGKAGLLTTVCLNASALLGMLIGGIWADRWSRTHPRARLLVPIIGLCCAAPAVLLIAKTPVLGLALAGLSLYGLARYFTDPNMMPILCLIVDSRLRATSWGISTFFSCIVGGMGIYAGGLLRDAHIDISRIFQFAAINLVICAVILYCLSRSKNIIAKE